MIIECPSRVLGAGLRMVSDDDRTIDRGCSANLVTGEATTYVYDPLGNLLNVTLPSGDVIEYLVDAMGRRVGKKVNGVLEKQWLWRGKLLHRHNQRV